MNKNKIARSLALPLALAIISSAPCHAMMFYFDTYVIADVGSGSYYFDALSDGPNTNWNGSTFTYNLLGGSTLTLKGGEVKAYRDDGGNYWNGNNTQTVFYSVYTNGATPSFSEFQILNGGSGGTVGFLGGNDFGATNSTGNVNLGNSISSSGSDWRVAIYFDGNASYDSGGQQYFEMPADGNGGANYVANVTAFYGATTTATQTSAFSGSGYFNFNGSGQTYTLDKNNTYTGETQIDAGTVALSGSGAIASSSVVKVGTNAVFDISSVTTSATVKGVSEQGNNDGGEVKLGSKDLVMTGGSGTYYLRILGLSGDTGTFTLNDSDSTLSLYGASQYTGATTLTAGTLATSAAMSSASYALGGGNLTTSSGADLSDTAAVNITSGSSTFTVGASDTIGSIAGTAGKVTITTNVVLTAGASGNTTFSGVIDGSGAFIKNGAGTLTFDGSDANTYSGTTTVNAGTLLLGKNGVNALAGTPTINNGGTIKLAAGNQFAGDTTFLTVNSGGVFDMNNFNETLAIQGTNGTVKLGSGTITINPTQTDSFAGTIEGTGALVKTNTGIQVLAGNSTYSGATTVGQGILLVAHNNALGATNSGTTVNTGAALQLSNGITTFREALTLNGTGVGGLDGALRNVSGNNQVLGNITLGSNARIGSTGGTMTVQGNVGGGANVLFVGGTGGNTAINGVVSGAGNSQDGTTTSLFKDGSGTLTLAGNNTYSGDTRVTAGRLSVSAGGNLGNGSSDVFVSSGAVLQVNNDAEVASLQETGNNDGGTASVGAAFTLTVSGNGYNTYMNSISGTGNLVKSGTGTMNLYGTQSRTGTTTVSGGKLSTSVAMGSSGVTVSGGTFETTAANILGNSVGVTVNGGTYSVGGSDTIGVLSGSGGAVDIASGTLTATYNSGSSSYAGNITGSGSFTKAGSDTLTLSGNNTKGGANTVSAGTLVVNGQLSGTTTVSSGATLAGSGSVGATTIGNGATISPGNSPGTLSLTNGFTLSSGGNYNWQIYNANDSLTAGQSNTWDLISVSGGALDLTGISSGNEFNINLWSLSAVSPDANGNAINFSSGQNYLWEIMTFTSLNGTFDADAFNIVSTAANGTSGFSNAVNGGVFSLAIDGDSINLLFTASNPTPSAVPEPGTWAAAAMLAGAAGYVRWRRRKEVEPKA